MGPFATAGTERIPYQEEPVVGASAKDVKRLTYTTHPTEVPTGF